MSRSRRALGLSLLLLLLAAPLQAEEADEATLDILVDTLRSNRKAFIAVNLGLSDEEAPAFWPIYDRYQKEISAVGDRLVRVIEEYRASFGKTTDAEAHKLVEDYLAVERDRTAVRQAYVAPFSEVLPGRKVMRFYQIENKIDAVVRFELAATIPVVEQ